MENRESERTKNRDLVKITCDNGQRKDEAKREEALSGFEKIKSPPIKRDFYTYDIIKGLRSKIPVVDLPLINPVSLPGNNIFW